MRAEKESSSRQGEAALSTQEAQNPFKPDSAGWETL